jgi:transposase-like protein
MSTTRRKFTREFKLSAVKRLQSGFPVGRVARELEVNPGQLHTWRRQFVKRPNSAFSGEGRRRQEETIVAELERKIGQQAVEIDFLKGCLRQIEELRKSQAEIPTPPSAGKSTKNGKGRSR